MTAMDGDEDVSFIKPFILITSLKKEGKTYQSIANTLNDNCYLTGRGNKLKSDCLTDIKAI